MTLDQSLPDVYELTNVIYCITTCLSGISLLHLKITSGEEVGRAVNRLGGGGGRWRVRPRCSCIEIR